MKKGVERFGEEFKLDKAAKLRFSVLLGLIFICLFLIIFVSGENSDSTSTSEWRMYGRNLNHTAWDGNNYTVLDGLNNINLTVVYASEGFTSIVNGYAYFGAAEVVYQLNASNITQQIANFTIGAPGSGADIGTSVVVVNGYAYFGSLNNRVYQLNASNISQQIANFTTQNDVQSSPAVYNGYVYIGSVDFRFYQLNASNISISYANYTALGGIYSSPAIANGYVYFSDFNHYVYQLNASNVSKYIANFTAPGNPGSSSPAVANGYVYIGAFDTTVTNNNAIYQLNASNITQQIANFTAYYPYSPAVANGYVYDGSGYLYIYQLNASNVSQQIANYSTDVDGAGSPVIANGYAYISTFDKHVLQLDASNISRRISDYAIGDVASPVTIANGYAYFGCGYSAFCQVNASNLSLENNCTSDWTCSDFAPDCVNGFTTRFCFDQNFCGTNLTRPALSRECTEEEENFVNPYSYTLQNQAELNRLANLKKNSQSEFSITNPNLDVTDVDITPSVAIPSATVRVSEETGSLRKSVETELPNGTVYKIFNINTSIDNSNISNATIGFKVNKTWLLENNFSINISGLMPYIVDKNNKTIGAVSLYRKDELGNWNYLGAEFVKQDNLFYYFRAITPGFSTFVVFFSEYECIPNTKRCFEQDIQLCVGNATWLITDKCQYSCRNGACSTTPPVASIALYGGIVVVISGGIIALIYVLYRKIRKRNLNNKL